MALTTGSDLFYYSTQTWLAHLIAEKFYGNIFYVYVSEIFDPSSQGSSNPKVVYEWFREICKNTDVGHPKYQSTTTTLKQVAREKMVVGNLTPQGYQEILWLIAHHGTYYFRPLIYVIRKDLVSQRVKPVPFQRRANPHSNEFHIEDLKPTEFDIISGL